MSSKMPRLSGLPSNENFYRQVLINSPDPIVLYDSQGAVVFANPSFEQVFGWSFAELSGKKIPFVPDEALQETLEAIARVKAGEPVRAFETRRRTKSGKILDVQLSSAQVLDSQGRVSGNIVIIRDISDQKAASCQLEEAALLQEESNRQLENAIERANTMAMDAEIISVELNQIFNASADGMWVIDKDYKVVRMNKRFAEMAGLDPFESVGQKCYELFPSPCCNDEHCPLKMVIATQERWVEEVSLNVEDKEAPFFIVAANRFLGLAGELVGIVVSFTDISKRKTLEEDLRRLATIDSLTGVFSRRYFLELAERELNRARRYDSPVSLLMLDVDHFKNINDTYGHPVGDEVLKKICATCKEELRSNDIMGRIGGEEFAIALPECDLENSLLIAERIRASLEESSLLAGGAEVKYTLSIGAAQFGRSAESLGELLKQADQALYHAKTNGRNQVAAARD